MLLVDWVVDVVALGEGLGVDDSERVVVMEG